MGQKAFKERLKEIQMSEYDAKVYEQFSSSVQTQVSFSASIIRKKFSPSLNNFFR